MKLTEMGQPTRQPWAFRTKNEVENWIEKSGIQNASFKNEFVIEVDGDVKLTGAGKRGLLTTQGQLPVVFSKTKNFDISLSGLTSLAGCPREVNNFDCHSNDLKAFLGAPAIINGNCDISYNPHVVPRSLYDIHKHFPQINGWISFEYNAPERNILGLLKIRGLTQVVHDDNHGYPDRLEAAIEIINKYLKEDRSSLKAQRELMKAGLKEFARL